MTGPRQTGKTTIAVRACQLLNGLGYHTWYIAIDNPSSSKFSSSATLGLIDAFPESEPPDGPWLIELWEQARREASRFERGLVLVLDEVQLIQRWSSLVKGLWDMDRLTQCPLQVVILGSAPWQMMTGLGDSLMGRFDALPVTHWSFPEIATGFGLTLDEYLYYGGYPGALADRPTFGRLEAWRFYITQSILTPAINRDIIGLTQIKKPSLMRNLIELTPLYSGQIMSYHKLLGRIQDSGNATTLTRYLDLLSDAGLITGLFRYTPAPHLGRSSPPKFNVFNTALMTAPSGYTFEQARADRSFWGRIVESAVGAHLCNTRGVVTRIHYWRKPPFEVDFVVVRGPLMLGIEVKSGRLRGRSGLSKFAKRFKNAKTVIVGTGGIPLREFLTHSADHWLEEL